jgi:hypothetical protein
VVRQTRGYYLLVYFLDFTSNVSGEWPRLKNSLESLKWNRSSINVATGEALLLGLISPFYSLEEFRWLEQVVDYCTKHIERQDSIVSGRQEDLGVGFFEPSVSRLSLFIW